MFDWLKKLFGGKEEAGIMMDESPETPVEDNTPEVKQEVEESLPETPSEEPIAQDSFQEAPKMEDMSPAQDNEMNTDIN